MNLSAPEQRLLDFAREQFGEQLSQFLLAGLGEEIVGQRGCFDITYDSSENAVLKRHVEVITYEPADGSSYLPCGRHPLVLITLLHLLLKEDQASSNNLHYEQKDVLRLLGWKDTQKAREEIEEAVKRYFFLTYKWKMNKGELTRSKLSFYEADCSLISENKLIDEEAREPGRERLLNQAIFNEHFIKQLLCRSLFSIDWSNVRSISRC